jgi:hypothetical protein
MKGQRVQSGPLKKKWRASKRCRERTRMPWKRHPNQVRMKKLNKRIPNVYLTIRLRRGYNPLSRSLFTQSSFEIEKPFTYLTRRGKSTQPLQACSQLWWPSSTKTSFNARLPPLTTNTASWSCLLISSSKRFTIALKKTHEWLRL